LPKENEAAPSALLVYRHRKSIWRMPLAPVMLQVLEPLLLGAPFGATLEGLEIATEQAQQMLSENLGAWFREWVRAGIFAAMVRS
jgi:hypothetical protein